MTNIKFPKFEISKAKNNEFKFNLFSSNGQIMITSDVYTQKHNCEKAIESVINHSVHDKNYEKKITNNGQQFYFTLKSKNGKIIGKSEMYESTDSRDNGIRITKKEASKSEIENNY